MLHRPSTMPIPTTAPSEPLFKASSKASPKASSKLTSKPPSITDKSLHFDYPGSDITLRSNDSHDFRVSQLYLANSSPVLRELIQSVLNTPDSHVPNGEEQTKGETPLPVVKLPESRVILHSLLTFIFPVPSVLPSFIERTMGLLAVAQKYQMGSVMVNIRGAISRRDPPFILPNTALYVYFLPQKYELHQEALLAAQRTLRLSMAIECLGGKIAFMQGVYLREPRKYHGRVRDNPGSSLSAFRKLGANIGGDLPISPIAVVPKPVRLMNNQVLSSNDHARAAAISLASRQEFAASFAALQQSVEQLSGDMQALSQAVQEMLNSTQSLLETLQEMVQSARRDKKRRARRDSAKKTHRNVLGSSTNDRGPPAGET
ncbi:hypothetical protein EDB87DRAFT_145981 [Lactarius vividus]|nr:hypothetical protein EDB87DRAFT_145981 [Lactarius vividus]